MSKANCELSYSSHPTQLYPTLPNSTQLYPTLPNSSKLDARVNSLYLLLSSGAGQL